jgi:hypothetical protein
MTTPEPAAAEGMRLPRLRTVWFGFFAVVAVLAITAWVLDESGEGAGSVVLLVIGLVATVDLGAMVWFRKLGDAALLTAQTNGELRAIYTRRFVLGATMAISPAVIAFAIAVAFGDLVPFVVGAGVSILALGYAGPREADIRAGDEALFFAGRPFRLSAALGG